MEYDQINHDTSAIDAAMKAARDRDLMGARSALNGSRAKLLFSSIPAALIAGTMFIGAAAASAWIMRPHFDFKTVEIDVPKLVEKQVDAPKLVDREVEIPKLVERDIEVPKLVEKPVEIPQRPAPGPLAELPPKTPDKAETAFINRPQYVSADFKGRIVRSFDSDLHFDSGRYFFPVKLDSDGKVLRDENGQASRDPNWKYDSDAFVGDYGYCNRTKEQDLWDCYVIHDDVVRPVPFKPTWKTWGDV
jgi:hypothetical protein